MISNVHVCFLSGGSRLQRRRPGLHGADDLEDQGGRQGEEMTSDLMTPNPPPPRDRAPAFLWTGRTTVRPGRREGKPRGYLFRVPLGEPSQTFTGFYRLLENRRLFRREQEINSVLFIYHSISFPKRIANIFPCFHFFFSLATTMFMSRPYRIMNKPFL